MAFNKEVEKRTQPRGTPDMTTANLERIAKLQQPTETAHYIVQFDNTKKLWELRGKMGSRTYFMNSCEFQAPLLIKQRDLEAKRSA